VTDSDAGRQKEDAQGQPLLPLLVPVAGIRGRLLGEHEEIVEDFLRQRVVRQQASTGVGDDEFVCLFTRTDGKAMVLLVFDDTDDFEFEALTVTCLDDQEIAKFDIFLSRDFPVVSVDDDLPSARSFR